VAITLTEAAAGEIKRYMEAQNVDQATVLRVAVAGGGCSGLQYSLGFDSDGFNPAVDADCAQHGVKLVVSKKMALHMDGTMIDFKEGPMGSGFSIDNPNVPRAGCPGCGHH
jgi:iron-sulfur cluster assembly protein